MRGDMEETRGVRGSPGRGLTIRGDSNTNSLVTRLCVPRHAQRTIAEKAGRRRRVAGPVVGLQIRRTDKVGTEAQFHGLDEYVAWAEVWFRVQELKKVFCIFDENLKGEALPRKIYIATDDASVFNEAKNK